LKKCKIELAQITEKEQKENKEGDDTNKEGNININNEDNENLKEKIKNK